MVKVRVKNRVRSNNLRTIKKRFPRFVSLMVMSFLGEFVFAGLMATSRDMISTLDKNLDTHSVYDLKVISDMGLTQDDCDAVAALGGVDNAECGKTLDVIALWDDKDTVINISSVPERLNRIDLLEGRLPESFNEIVVEKNFLSKEGLELGDSVTLDSDTLETQTVTIVGTVDSPLYYNCALIGQTRGSTGIGSGKISYYAYCSEELFGTDYYSVIFVTAVGAEDEMTADEGYCNIVDAVRNELESISTEREQARYDGIYEEAKAEIDDAGAEAEAELADAWDELEEARRELSDAKDELDEAEKTLEALEPYTYYSSEAKKQYDEGLEAYESGLEEYNSGMEEYEEGLAEYYEAKEEADDEIADAEAELAELEMPNWHIFDRTSYTTYTDYIDDSNSVHNLAKIFPLVFFAVAVLVSLISMNRMVEEDRLEIGTMKSMGFPDSMIMSKYLLFSLLATIIGGILGAAGGLVVIPELIFNIYKIIFTLPPLVITVQPVYTAIGFVLTVLCVCGTSVWTVHNVLKEKPAALLRQKAPKNGKRIILERIPFVWKGMKFSKKVTARNIFRYKKRVLVTIGGIAGCTALMLTGFGVKDAIVDIPSTQYYDIYQFDATAYVSGYGEEDGIEISDITYFDEVTCAVPAQRITADLEDIDGFIQIVNDDSELEKIALLCDVETGEQLHLEHGKAIINEKLSAMTGLKAGDTVTVTDVDNNTLTVEISGVAVNYIEHFAFIDAGTYDELGYTFKPNIIYMQTRELDEAQKDVLAEEILEEDCVLSFSYRDDLIDGVDRSLQSLDSVVMILVVLSAMLAFVVLYNLSNININERKREIATLKVLGFYDNEVDAYITRETVLLTAIGIALGLVFGIFLSRAVVNTVEIEKCRFINSLRPMSFVWSALMSTAFTEIVNIITHFNLKKINMIDSLKSVE